VLAGSLAHLCAHSLVRVCDQALPKMQQMRHGGNLRLGRVQCIRVGIRRCCHLAAVCLQMEWQHFLSHLMASHRIASQPIPSHLTSPHCFLPLFCLECSISRPALPPFSWVSVPPFLRLSGPHLQFCWGKCCYQGECKSITKINLGTLPKKIWKWLWEVYKEEVLKFKSK